MNKSLITALTMLLIAHSLTTINFKKTLIDYSQVVTTTAAVTTTTPPQLITPPTITVVNNNNNPLQTLPTLFGVVWNPIVSAVSGLSTHRSPTMSTVTSVTDFHTDLVLTSTPSPGEFKNSAMVDHKAFDQNKHKYDQQIIKIFHL